MTMMQMKTMRVMNSAAIPFIDFSRSHDAIPCIASASGGGYSELEAAGHELPAVFICVSILYAQAGILFYAW